MYLTLGQRDGGPKGRWGQRVGGPKGRWAKGTVGQRDGGPGTVAKGTVGQRDGWKLFFVTTTKTLISFVLTKKLFWQQNTISFVVR